MAAVGIISNSATRSAAVLIAGVLSSCSACSCRCAPVQLDTPGLRRTRRASFRLDSALGATVEPLDAGMARSLGLPAEQSTSWW